MNLLLLLPLFAAFPPVAQEPEPPKAPPAPAARGQSLLGSLDFKAADRDGNGSLSTEELSAAAFARLDANGDGKLSAEELASLPAPGRRRPRASGGEEEGRAPRLRSLDANGDGFVDASEFRFPSARYADEDGDGAISAEELSRLKERAGRFARGGEGPEGGPPQGAGPDGRLRRLDADGDGAISRSEWKGDPSAFERMDANRDGKLAGEEIRESRGEDRPRREGGLLAGGNPMEFDKNGDGKLAPKEFSAYLFSRLDGDRDGSLVPEELRGIPMPPRYGTGKEGTGPERLMQDLDHDRDGKVSSEEFVLPERVWRVFDRDRDDFVKPEELPRSGEGPGAGRGRAFQGLEIRSVEEALSRMDADKNGELSSAEWKGPRQAFERWDSDKDGKLSKAELESGIEKARAAGLIREPDDFVARHDKNKDGKVTREEFEGPAEAFDRADANGDGVITAADRPAGTPPPPAEPPKKKKEKRRERV